MGTSEGEVEYRSSPEQDVSKVVFKLYESPDGIGGTKQWAVGLDSRGVHTFYTEPNGSQLIYYHKPISTDFNGSTKMAETYLLKKEREKVKKGYAFIGNCQFFPNERIFS